MLPLHPVQTGAGWAPLFRFPRHNNNTDRSRVRMQASWLPATHACRRSSSPTKVVLSRLSHWFAYLCPFCPWLPHLHGPSQVPTQEIPERRYPSIPSHSISMAPAGAHPGDLPDSAPPPPITQQGRANPTVLLGTSWTVPLWYHWPASMALAGNHTGDPQPKPWKSQH